MKIILSKKPRLYEIRIEGHLAARRFGGFEGLEITHKPNGETVLVGSIPDQSALYGLLSWLQNLGATLLLVRQMEKDEALKQENQAGEQGHD